MRTFDSKKPIKLQSSRAWRTYLGGKMISRLHGEEGEDGHFPEEWLMSTVAARNSGREHIVEGPSLLWGSTLTLKELIEKDPVSHLGDAHVARYGSETGVLVKLLDAAERLTLQVHPTRECAMRLFSSPFGKTECWHILSTRRIGDEAPCIYLGFKEGVTRERWEAVFATQDIPAMLSMLHRIEIHEGDTFIIRGGVPHGIGAGCFLVEIQEPTDYTVRTERVTPSGLPVADAMCHQGLGFEKMFECFDYEGLSLEETLARYRVTPITEEGKGYTLSHIIYRDVTDMFSLDLYTVKESVTVKARGDFYGLYVLSGEGLLDGEPIGRCDHFFVPASAKDVRLEARGEEALRVIACYGPASSS